MALLKNNLAGLTAGDDLNQGSGGNTGGASGDFFDTVNPNNTAAVEADADVPSGGGGGKSILFTGASAGAAEVRWTPAGSARAMAARCYYKFPATPTSVETIIRPRVASADAGIWRLKNVTPQFLWSSPALVDLWSPSGTLSLDTWYRLEFILEQDAGTRTTTNGRLRARYFLGHSTTFVDEVDTGFTTDVGILDYSNTRFGRQAGPANIFSFKGTYFAMNIGATTWIGPEVSAPLWTYSRLVTIG